VTELPLSGLRILAFEQFGAGPFATLNLADMGAEVIKIEDPTTGGEVSRTVPPYRVEDDSIYFQSWNRNKSSLTLNLRRPEARAVLLDLVRVSDVVFNNLRSDQPAKLGLTYECLRGTNPRVVCCSLSGFGSWSARASEPGYDYLMQAAMGYMRVTGDPAGPPTACGVSFIDHAAGFAAAMAILAAVLAARERGTGRDVEVSLSDTALSMLTYLAAWTMNRNFELRRYPGSAHQTLVPVQTFRTSDGYLTIFCGKEKFWRLLCECFGDSALAEQFPTFERRMESRAEVVDKVQAHFLRRQTDEWLQLLSGKVPCAPVRTISEALDAATAEQSGAIVCVDHPVWGRLREVNTPARFSARPRIEHEPAPTLGAQTESILRDYLGYAQSHIDELRLQGAI
jgi:crotonobetainyl-CoA:carnitine CoA-transferase CaiB-like acyl-CoA transferase